MELTVSLDTYKALTLLLQSEQDTYENVISRLLVAARKAEQLPQAGALAPDMARWFEYGVELPVGTQLRRKYKGQEYVATVQLNGLELNGKLHNSLSAAGYAVTGYNLNGWDFWQFLNPQSGKWEAIGILRS